VDGGEKRLSLLKLFLLFVKIGAVTIGGGYVMIPLMQKEFGEKRKLLDIEDFLNIMALAQCGPGGVAINASTVMGYRIRGVAGAVLATIGTVLPSFLAIVVLAFFLLKYRDTSILERFLSGARPAVVGLLIAVAYSLGREAIKEVKALVLALGAVVALLAFDVHPVLIILVAGLAGQLLYGKKRREKVKEK